MNVNVRTLSNAELDRQLEARHSRTSGNRLQKEDRLQRFLDFEDQKKRHHNYVQEARMTALDDYQDAVNRRVLDLDQDQEDEEAASILMDLRNHPDGLRQRMARLEDDNSRLNRIVDTLEKRISELEVADMPPLAPILPDSNPNWVYDETATSPYAWECTTFDI
jgi:HEAT repeat protein